MASSGVYPDELTSCLSSLMTARYDGAKGSTLACPEGGAIIIH